MARSEELQVVVRAVDQASATLEKIHADLQKMGVNAQATSSHIDALGNKLTSLGQRIKEGFGEAIGQGIFNALETGLHSVLDLYPRIISMGDAYLEQMHQIQLETGMTAEQTSVLVGAAKNLNISVDNLEPLFAKLGKNLGSSEGHFRALGVATRDANGNMLGAYQIIDNLRHQVSLHGEALLSTAAAQELFGRGGYQLLSLLQQSDAQWKESITNVERWGGVMSQQAIDGAHRFNVEMASLQTGVLDIATNIFAQLTPYLSAFVDAFSTFVQNHLQEIINFAVQVAATVMGVIGGLFGFTVDFSKALDGVGQSGYHAAAGTDEFGKSAKAAKSGVDAFTAGINAQIKAIDRHIQAMTEAAQKRRAIEEEQKLRKSLADARAQLADLQGNSPFLGGLSAAEQVLAMQKHAQDIANAKKAVGDAEQSLGNFELDQRDQAERRLLERQKQRLSDELAAHKATNAAIANSGLQMAKGIDTSFGTSFKNIGVDVAKFQQTAQAAFKSGSDAAQSFIEILLGKEMHQDPFSGAGSYRTGGVVGALGALGDILGEIGGAARWAISQLGPVGNWFAEEAQVLNALTGRPTTYYTGKPGYFDPIEQLLKSLGLDLFPKHAEGGWVGLHGPELGLYGEKGPEYVTPTHELGTLSTPRGGSNIHFTLDFLFPPTEEQLRQVTNAISRRLAFDLNHAPVTSMPNGAF